MRSVSKGGTIPEMETETNVDEAPVEPPKQGRQRRGSELPAQGRELQRMIESYAAKLAELAKEAGEQLTRKAEKIVIAARLAEAREHEDHAKVRAALNTITGGAVERLVRVSKEEDIKAFLHDKGWRV